MFSCEKRGRSQSAKSELENGFVPVLFLSPLLLFLFFLITLVLLTVITSHFYHSSSSAIIHSLFVPTLQPHLDIERHWLLDKKKKWRKRRRIVGRFIPMNEGHWGLLQANRKPLSQMLQSVNHLIRYRVIWCTKTELQHWCTDLLEAETISDKQPR